MGDFIGNYFYVVEKGEGVNENMFGLRDIREKKRKEKKNEDKDNDIQKEEITTIESKDKSTLNEEEIIKKK